ncbi:MAG TPA: tyrosine recombinase XerC [Steroidobacteraceae bacterium]|nr:tyrosine recombinase XerC [Steroidobacteraceae bacterium]
MNAGALAWTKGFIKHLRTERRLSGLTAGSYTRDIAALTAFCDAQKLPDWKSLDSQYVRVFAAKQHARGLSPRSIQRQLSAIRTFLSYLIREGVLSSNPAQEVRAPKGAKRLPHTLDADQMSKLLDFRTAEGLGVRDKAMMELLYSSGLRLQELISLDLTDLDLADRTLRVTGKGNKTRILPIGRYAVEATKAWLKERAAIAAIDEAALFVGRNGHRIGARAVQLRIDHWARQSGLGVKTHPHLFRHSFATHLLESSGNLRGVQELLGHANISTTQVYTHLDFQHLARIYDASHPRARRKRSR